MDKIIEVLKDDKFASSFQTLDQYRKSLIELVEKEWVKRELEELRRVIENSNGIDRIRKEIEKIKEANKCKN